MISGPINTVINVRSTSQLERNQMALEMYQELLKVRQGEPEIRVAKFQFRNSQGSKVDPPLSWRLSPTQKAAVQSAWQAITAEARPPIIRCGLSATGSLRSPELVPLLNAASNVFRLSRFDAEQQRALEIGSACT